MVRNLSESLKSPNYYIRKRLLNNKPAVGGLIVILASTLVALLGYLIMPDQTPDANDGAIQIQKQLPGFAVKLLKIRKNREIEDVGFFSKMIGGQENKFTIIPVNGYEISGLTILADEVDGTGNPREYSLVNAVKPLYIGASTLLNEAGDKVVVEDGKIRFLNAKGEIEETSHENLVREFEVKNVENRTYWLGTDRAGRDMLSRLIYGTRISLAIGFIAVVISMILGITLGALAGYFGGSVDKIIMWFMSVVWSIPGIMLVIAISLVLQSRGLWVAFLAVGLTMWVDVARVVRGQIISIKQKLYIEAARAAGIKKMQIIRKHVMPNILGPLIVIATSNFAAAIILEAGLSFFGMSVQPPTPSWGIMIYEGYSSIGTADSWHLIVLPGIAISTLVLAFNLLGNGLRDAYDPQTMVK